MSGRPQTRTLHLPDDPRSRYPDSSMRVECRRHKAASEDMLHKAALTSVRTSQEAATAAHSYQQAQIMQLSYDLAQLREQLKTLTEQQSHDTAAYHRPGTPPLNPTATTYRPTSHTVTRAYSQESNGQDPSRPITGAVNVSPAPGNPAASTTPSPRPALPRASITKGGFAVAFKTAVSKSKARSTSASVASTGGSSTRAGTSTPPSAPTTELTPPASGLPSGDAVKRMLDLAQVGGYLDSEGDY